VSAADDNRALVHRLIEIVNAGDVGALREVVSGPLAEETERWIGPFRESFPDFRMEVVDVIVEDHKVVGHFRCSGTQQGEWRGHPPSGRRFEGVDEICIFAVERGRLAIRLAAVQAELSRLRQLGLA
jgi:hypothetical protein